MVTIPFDYENLPPVRQAAIVPICICRHDPEGREIAWGWFEAVSKVQNPLRRLVRNLLFDEWRTSEVTDWAVLHNWTRHGADFGRAPHRRVYVTAYWHTQNLRAGDRRARRGVDVPLEGVDWLVDRSDYEARYCSNVDFVRLAEKLKREGVPDVSTMLVLQRSGYSWKEIGQWFTQQPNTAQRRFWRWARKVVHRES